MFTGLIADLGEVVGCRADAEGETIEVGTKLARELSEGDSIALDGVCLTATRVTEDAFAAQAMAETLRRSALSELRPGRRVNLELALRLGDRLGGHIVQGHVDGVGTLVEVRTDGFARVLAVEAEPALLVHMVEKGSVALAGVSLTVSALSAADRFEVSLIPETLKRTTLGAAAVGDRLNIEVDVLAKHVERLVGSTLSAR